MTRQQIDQAFMDWTRSGPKNSLGQRDNLRFGQYFVNKYLPKTGEETCHIFYCEDLAQTIRSIYEYCETLKD